MELNFIGDIYSGRITDGAITVEAGVTNWVDTEHS